MQRWRWWWWFRRWLSLMTSGGHRCHRQNKMMGRGPDGGCGTDERPCRLIRVPAALSQPENSATTTITANKKPTTSLDIDFFSQARKALCERCPFDIPEDGFGSGSICSSTFTLPSALASLLKQSDGRKRHKRSHSGADKKSSWRPSERSKGGSIWVETEEYFRDLALQDVEALYEISSSLRSLASRKCFLIPYFENEKKERTELVVDGENVDNSNSNGNVKMDCEKGSVNGNGVVMKDEVKQEDGQFMEIVSVGGQSDSIECSPQEEEKVCSVSDSSSGLEWLLGCRSRAILTSERPSKKRKLLGSDAGLDKILIGCPCKGNLLLCDVCCKGETGNDSNGLVVCSSCKFAVHRKCYGVQGDVDESWLCSWCNQKTDGNGIVEHPCVLCPKQGGALKSVGPENGGSVEEFAHLFCSQWMPEVFIEDLTKMEPIMSVAGIRETRRKLVCHICKVKCGACIRCSHGTCRTAFHPICAREAGHRMEVWGKYGCDNVELRAFCSKHSEFPDHRNNPQVGDPSVAVGSDCSVANHTAAMTENQHKLKIAQNGDKIAVHEETPDANSDKSCDSEIRELGLSNSKLNAILMSECGTMDQLTNTRMFERSDNEGASLSDRLDLALILKKLIERGKVNMKSLAVEIGISPDSLISALAEDSLVPDLQCKIVKWLRNHAYMGTLRKNQKVKLKSIILSKNKMGTADHSVGVTVSDSDITDPVAVKSVPPRRRTKSNIRLLRDNKVICSSEEILSDNGVAMDEVKPDPVVCGEPENSAKLLIPDTPEQGLINPDGHDASAAHLSKPEGISDNLSDGSISEKIESGHVAIPGQINSTNSDEGSPVCSDVNPVLPDLVKTETFSAFYVHPSINKRLLQMQGGMISKNRINGFEGSRVGEMSHLEASSNASVCCNHQSKHSKLSDLIGRLDGVNSEQLIKANKLGVFELSPADEVEGEIIYFQHRLLENAVSRKHFIDNLICKVARSLPQEIDAARRQRWDAVLVNQYLSELREAKKQGRKERRHKEAQAVLAAATAAAAASSRISSFRKDTFDECANQEKFNTSNGRAGMSSQLMPRPKETLSRVAVPRTSSEKYSESVQLVSDFSKEHPRSCDICRRSETILNPILVCSSCKVAVHLDCYRCIKESTGPWYCELCEELLSSTCSGCPSVNFWEKPYFVAECGLCGGTTGAFRKSTDGQWIHAFCAEWVFEPTFRRGQVNPVDGMETVAKGIEMCCICRRKHGVCIKCSYGHCQTMFHPSCARSMGFYMSVKTLNGKLLHKAYCEKHSWEQRAKAETQKHGVEEIKSIKQIRVELERLRLLCERIIRREKIKRDLVLCSHSILASKRDHVARSVLVHSPFFPPDVSSESATTSLKGNTDGYKSCSDAIQRSDDVTVDSTVSVKHRVKVTMSMDTDQKTDDSSTSQNLFTRKPTERVPFAGKQIPQRSCPPSHNLFDDGEWSSKSRKTFEKELVMTSDQASMKNQQLPKGYFYIPVDCLQKEKQVNQDACSGGPLEHDG